MGHYSWDIVHGSLVMVRGSWVMGQGSWGRVHGSFAGSWVSSDSFYLLVTYARADIAMAFLPPPVLQVALYLSLWKML